jgi:hypothetical protein
MKQDIPTINEMWRTLEMLAFTRGESSPKVRKYHCFIPQFIYYLFQEMDVFSPSEHTIDEANASVFFREVLSHKVPIPAIPSLRKALGTNLHPLCISLKGGCRMFLDELWADPVHRTISGPHGTIAHIRSLLFLCRCPEIDGIPALIEETQRLLGIVCWVRYLLSVVVRSQGKEGNVHGIRKAFEVLAKADIQNLRQV